MRIRYLLASLAAAGFLLWWLCVLLAALHRGYGVSHCPSCRSDRIRHSWPTFHDKLLGYSSLIPWRCEACYKRFYVLKSPEYSSTSLRAAAARRDVE